MTEVAPSNAQSSTPDALVPLYGVQMPVLLHQGELTAKATREADDDHVVSGPGTVVFESWPYPHAAWQLVVSAPDAYEVGFGPGSDYELSTPVAGVIIPPASQEVAELPIPDDETSAVVDGTVPRRVYGTREALTELRFHIINWPITIGREFIRHPSGRQHLGRTVLDSDDWVVTLDAVDGIDELLKAAEVVGGYAVTHIGSLRRADGAAFEISESDEVMVALFGYLAFTRAGTVGVALNVGLDAHGAGLCARWECTRVDRAGYRPSWYPEHRPDALQATWPGFLALYAHDYWKNVLPRVVLMQCAANESPVERGLMTACSTLELLSWSVLTEVEGLLTPAGYEKLAFADCLRLLLRWAGVDPAFPPMKTDFEALAKAFTQVDAPECLAFVRNRVVHPDKKQQLKSGSLIDAWFIALWYIDLIVLRLLGYEGVYANRLRLGRWAGEVDPVPWSTEASS